MSESEEFQQAVSLQDDGKYEEAVEAFGKVIEQESGNADAWYRKAVCLYELGRYPESMECVTRAIELKPGDLQAMKLKFALAGKA